MLAGLVLTYAAAACAWQPSLFRVSLQPQRPADLLVAAAGADRAHALLAELRHRRRAAHLELALLLVDAALAFGRVYAILRVAIPTACK